MDTTPAQRLMGRRCRTLLPMPLEKLLLEWQHECGNKCEVNQCARYLTNMSYLSDAFLDRKNRIHGSSWQKWPSAYITWTCNMTGYWMPQESQDWIWSRRGRYIFSSSICFSFWTDKSSFFLDYRTVLPKLRRARIPKRQHWLTSSFLIAPVNLYSAVYSLTSFNHCVLANGFVWVWADCRRNMWF